MSAAAGVCGIKVCGPAYNCYLGRCFTGDSEDIC